MNLSTDLIAQFVEITNDNVEPNKQESTLYGTTVEYNGSIYVRLDGSDILTPVVTTADAKPNERVTVMIKNHSAVITGNMSSPAARSGDVKQYDELINHIGNKISEFDILIADKVNTDIFDAEVARINELKADNLLIRESLSAAEADIDTLVTENATITERLTANDADISNIKTNKLDTVVAEATYATIEELDATNVSIRNLEATFGDFEVLSTGKFTSMEAAIGSLETNKLSASDIEGKYANIDFSNIGSAAMEYLYSTSGLIENVIVENGEITGRLVGVTIIGDTIEAGTLKADKLVIKGEDGLYYKLNTDGITTEAEQTNENSLNGTVIQAKSITASKVSVSDLVAFDATIGGFNITDNAIYSEVKDSEDNVTRGIYMDTDGQINFGDASNFIKYYRDTDGSYKLAISAASILYALDGKQYSIADIGQIGNYVRVSTYEGEPCIELGENDSDFRLIITNTRIMFMEGSDVPAYINNQSLNIKKAIIEEELQQGGFVWKIRSNGNMGLVWKGFVAEPEPDEPTPDPEPDEPTPEDPSESLLSLDPNDWGRYTSKLSTGKTWATGLDASTGRIAILEAIPVEPNTDYTFTVTSLCDKNWKWELSFFDVQGLYIKYIGWETTSPYTFNTGNAYYLGVVLAPEINAVDGILPSDLGVNLTAKLERSS